MIRTSEVVLPGHPDKFCDQVADAIIAACYRADPRAYCQVEVSVWDDRIFLTGGIVTRRPIHESTNRRHGSGATAYTASGGRGSCEKTVTSCPPLALRCPAIG